MKTKEELNALKMEVEALNKKLAELTEDELAQVSGGTSEAYQEAVKKIGFLLLEYRGQEKLIPQEKLQERFAADANSAVFNDPNLDGKEKIKLKKMIDELADCIG